MTLRLNGSTSGYVEIDAPAVAGTSALTLPTGTGTLAKTTDSGLQLITTQSFSAASSVSVNNCFTSDFDNYRILVSVDSSSNSSINLVCKLRSSGTTTSTNYKSILWTIFATDWTSGSGSSIPATTYFIAGYRHATTTSSYSLLDIMGPQKAQVTQMHGSYGSTASGNGGHVTGVQTDTTQFDSVIFEFTAGTFTGSLSVYGYRKA